MDYRWVAKAGRAGDQISPMQRLHDLSLTRRSTFLQDPQPAGALAR
jgi:hypothetical protein